MTNGTNTWGVSFPTIRFAEQFFSTHPNVASWTRKQDILVFAQRVKQGDLLHLLLLEEYTMSLARVQQALAEFGHLDVIWGGGNWAGYTPQAKQYCLDANIGLYNTSEMHAALYTDAYWDFAKRDSRGNRVDCSRSA